MDLQYQGLQFIQSPDCFPFGTDAVLLASFVRLKRGELCVDLGTGTGILPVLLSGRHPARFCGIEIQKTAAALARKNVELNGLSDRVQILEGDLKNARQLVEGHVSAVVCNPPYQPLGSGEVSLKESERIARFEVCAGLEDVIQSAAGLLKTKGRFYMVHRPVRLAEALALCSRYGLTPKKLRLVQPTAEKDPCLFLLESVKDAAAGLEVPAPLILRTQQGDYTEETKKIYHLEEGPCRSIS